MLCKSRYEWTLWCPDVEASTAIPILYAHVQCLKLWDALAFCFCLAVPHGFWGCAAILRWSCSVSKTLLASSENLKRLHSTVDHLIGKPCATPYDTVTYAADTATVATHAQPWEDWAQLSYYIQSARHTGYPILSAAPTPPSSYDNMQIHFNPEAAALEIK